MTEVEVLLLVVAAIYLSECVVWLPARCRVLTGIPGRMRHAATPDVLGNEHKQLFVLSLLPTSATFVARSPGYLLSREGLLFEDAERRWQLIAFDQITVSAVQVDGTHVDLGEHRCQAGTSRTAHQLSEMIRRLVMASERDKLIAAHLQRHTDPDRAERRVGVLRHRLQNLHQLQFMLLSWTLGAGTFLYYFSAEPWRALVYYLVIFAIIWLVTVTVTWCCHRRLYPGRLAARWKELFFSCVSPMHAVRATDRLSLEALGDEHPLAVAMATVPSHRLEVIAREQLAELRHPLTSESTVTENLPAAALQEARKNLANALADSLQRKGIDPEMLCIPDQRDNDAVCWCPRCFNQYTISLEECPDCSGVGVRAFDTT